jgi:hypothetical protein
MEKELKVELFLHEDKMNALNRVLNSHGTDAQTVMQARFEALYRQYVSTQEQIEINCGIVGRRLAAEARAERDFTMQQSM